VINSYLFDLSKIKEIDKVLDDIFQLFIFIYMIIYINIYVYS